MLFRGRDGLGGAPRGRGNGAVRVGDQVCDPHLPPHTPTRAWGLPVPEGSLAAPAPRPALHQPLRLAASAPPRLRRGPGGAGAWEPGTQPPDRFARLVPAPSPASPPSPHLLRPTFQGWGCPR